MPEENDEDPAAGETRTPAADLTGGVGCSRETSLGSSGPTSGTRRRFLLGVGALGLGRIGTASGAAAPDEPTADVEEVAPGVYNWADPGGYSGPDSGRSTVDPESGRIYKARDSGRIYHGNGSTWVPLPGMYSRIGIPATFSDTAELERSYSHEPDVPLEFVGVENLIGEGSGSHRGPAVVLRSLDDQRATRLLLHDGSGGTAEKSAYIGRYNADRGTTSEVLKVEPNSVELEAEVPGEQLNLQEGHTTSRTEALMTFQTSDGAGDKTTRLDVSGGERLAHIRTRQLDEFRFGAVDDDGDGTRDVSTRARFVSFAGHNYSVRNDRGRLRFEDEASGDFLDVAGNGKLDLRNLSGLRGPPEYSNADPEDLQNYEIAFDTDRGGTGETALLYKDRSGETHYWDADGTL